MAVLQLVEKGKLDLDAPLQRYVPGFPEKPWPVTCRHLLCHQSGVRQWTDEEFRSTRHYWNVAESMDFFKDDPSPSSPARARSTPASATACSAAAIEAPRDEAYADYLRESVFVPAGMETARLDDVFALIPHRAHGYQKGPGGEIVSTPCSPTRATACPAAASSPPPRTSPASPSPSTSGALLTRDSREQMFTRQKGRDGKLTGYGLGWTVDGVRGRREVYHVGGQPRVSTVLYMRPDQDVAVVLLANLEGVSAPLLELARQAAGHRAQALGAAGSVLGGAGALLRGVEAEDRAHRFLHRPVAGERRREAVEVVGRADPLHAQLGEHGAEQVAALVLPRGSWFIFSRASACSSAEGRRRALALPLVRPRGSVGSSGAPARGPAG